MLTLSLCSSDTSSRIEALISFALIFEIMLSTASRYLMESSNMSDQIAGDES
jgi:hypothetical protein